VPAFSRAIVENYDENGPFGAKGIGNSSVINMAPAVANAVFALTGTQLKELPVLPEKILNEKATSMKK
jgi:CO/xanthine dehydrogenase Mo-binding subunit